MEMAIVKLQTFYKGLDGVITHRICSFGISDIHGPVFPKVIQAENENFVLEEIKENKSKIQVPVYRQVLDGELDSTLHEMDKAEHLPFEQQLEYLRKDIFEIRKKNLILVDNLNRFTAQNRQLLTTCKRLEAQVAHYENTKIVD